MADIKKLLESFDRIGEDKAKIKAPAPRNVVAKNAKTSGAGQHKNPREIENTRKEKHKKDFLKDLHEAEKDTRILRRIEEAYSKFKEAKMHISPSGVKTNMDPSDDDYAINYGKNGLVAKHRKELGLDVETGEKKDVAEDTGTHKYQVVVKGHKRSYSVWVEAKNEEVAIIKAQQYVAREHNDTAKRAAVVDMKQGVAEGVDIGQEWMSDTELDQYVPRKLQQQWRELLGYDENGNPSDMWVAHTDNYEPDSNNPQHRQAMVELANWWFYLKQIPNFEFFDVRDTGDELEWLVHIGPPGWLPPYKRNVNEFVDDRGGDGGGGGEELNPRMAKMAYDEGLVKGVSLADGATTERAMAINHWDTHDGGIYKQHFAKGFIAGRKNKINHDNKQYNLNLKLMKDGSIRHSGQGVAEGSQEDAKFTPRFEVRSRVEQALEQYLDPERVAGGHWNVGYYKHDGKVYIEVLFNYSNGSMVGSGIGPTQRKRFLVNKDLTLTPIAKQQGVAEGLKQTLRKVVPGYAKREIDQKMDAGKFGKTDADKDANFHRYKKIQDKMKEQGVAEGSNQAGVVVKISGREYAAMSPEQKAVKQREWQQLKQQAKKRLQTFTIVDTDKEQGVTEELKMKKQQEFYGKNQRLPDTSTSLAKRSIGWPEVPNVPRTDDGTPTVQHRFHGKGIHTRLDPRPEQTRVQRKDAGKEKPIPSFLQKGMAETSDVSGLLAASKLNNSYIITAELAEGGTKKFRVKAQSERVALEKFKKHYAMAKVIDVTPEVQEATTMPTSPTAPTSATSTTTTSATQQKPLNLQAVQQQLKIPGNPAPGSTSAGSTNPQDMAVQAVIQKAMAGKPLDSAENNLYHSILQKANK